MSLPDCCYDYRYERKSAEVVDVCDECKNNIYLNTAYYEINNVIYCKNCMEEFKRG